MPNIALAKEADLCRRRALEFQGRPEAAFLLQVATAFEDLASHAKTIDDESKPPASA